MMFLQSPADSTTSSFHLNKEKVLTYIWSWRSFVVALATPLILLPFIVCFENDPTLKDPMRCAYVLLLMIVLWITETLPLAITALIPMVLYPVMSLVKATVLAPQYMSETNISLIGSILVIGAFERAGLHKRFALRVLTLVGAQPRWLLLGFMLVTWFFSMWTSNTVTTVLLLPIVLSITAELRNAINAAMVTAQQQRQSASIPNQERQNADKLEEQHGEICQRRYQTMLLLALAFSSSIGGTATVIGTGPNLIMKQQLEEVFKAKGCQSPLNFLSWMIFAVPMSLLVLAMVWLWLLVYFFGPLYAFGCRHKTGSLDHLQMHRAKVERAIRQIYDDLPPLDFEQIVVLGHCGLMIALLITRQLGTSPLIGWELLAPNFVKESTAALLPAISLFLFPIKLPYRDQNTGQIVPPKMLNTWTAAEKNFPIGLVLLIGGGMAASYGAEVSGLASLIARLLNDLVSNMSDIVALIVIIVCVAFITEFMSNTACVTLVMPVLRELAEYRHGNPMLFMFPATLAASFAFMFPIATPPNAIVFETGKFRIIDMIAPGFVVNLIAIGVAFFASTTYGALFFHLFEVPWTALPNNNGTLCKKMHLF